jgi:flagellar assembly protein FliH
MVSKVLSPDTVEITPAAWRKTENRPRQVAPDSSESGAGESAVLRARLVETSKVAEQQARAAHEAGFRAGEASGRSAAQKQVEETVRKLSESIAQVAEMRAQTISRAEDDVVRLAIEIARRILHRELSVDPSALEALIKAALEKLQVQEVFRVRAHPEQHQMIRACLEEMGRGSNVEVVGDPSQPRGGAVFETARGALDASVETQLREIERGLIDQLNERL